MPKKKEETASEHKKKHSKDSRKLAEEIEKSSREHVEEEKEILYKEHEEKVERDEVEEEKERSVV